ncbi:MAG: DUF6165 family protein [Beijerinckiaceae bacterium]|nr:DUF6165 family protein [Beijerinckiaceae bacterium]
MNIVPVEQKDRAGDDAKFRTKALLQTAVAGAFALLNAGKGQEAISQIELYADIAAQSHTGCYVFGLIYLNAGELGGALKWFNRALGLQPAFPEALSAVAIVQQRLGQPHDALESFKAVVKLRPHDSEAFYGIGVVSQSLGRMSEALAAYEEALRRSPDHCDALTNRGALLERFGRIEEALECFDAIAAIRPEDSANLFNRGSVLQKLGRLGEALAAYEDSARLGPPDADTELNRGNVLQRLGRLDEALTAYDRASQYRDGYPQALYNKGIALQALGRPHGALAAYDAALALDPSFYEASCNRGNVLHDLGLHEDALAACTYTLRIRPGYVPALANRANILLRLGRAEEASAACGEVLRLTPEHPQCLGIRGAALHESGRLEEALASLNEAVRTGPLVPEAWLNRGNVLQALNRHLEAVESYNEALRIRPHYPEALSGLGVAQKELGRIDESLASFNEALRHKPNYPDARNNRAGALLLKGRFREGFEDFESRWERSNAPPKTLITDMPQWNGQELAGTKILVWDEQGLGDLIQFSRYLLCLVEAGAEVTLLCRKNMQRLMRSLPVPIRFIETLDSREDFAFQSALMSLPRGFGTNLESIPARIPYLRAEPGLVEKWAARIGAEGFRIGIVWQGNLINPAQRPVPLPCFAPVAAIEGVRLISLTKEQGVSRVETPGGGFTVEKLGTGFDAGPDAFVDCAAVMASLDLVISADTAIVHLAGALGVPVFAALKSVPDWRWLLNRDDSPWYPGMRLFRQAERGDWEPVFRRIAWEAEVCVKAKASHTKTEGPAAAAFTIPVSVGELIDKITILEIKESRMSGARKLANVRCELSLLRKLKSAYCLSGARLDELSAKLKEINGFLWETENAVRAHEARNDFGASFVALARQIYKANEQRAELKRSINLLFQSAIIEEKAYSLEE